MATLPPPGGGVPREIVVPGSIANLGPGFDALSVAVTVYLRLNVTEVLPASPGMLELSLQGGPPLVGENRIVTAFERAAARFGGPAAGVRADVQSDIPMRAGLGSSAAATVAGLRLYEALTAPRPVGDWLALATDIEGHPDNAAAALLGGLTLSCQREDGSVIARSCPWPADVQFVVGTPQAELETAFARKVLPQTLPLKDAIYNLQRALLLLRALDTGQHDDLREALRDRWHQPVRQQYVPGLKEALALDHPAVIGACLSGAGPSIALFTAGRSADAAALLGRIYEDLGVPYTMRTLLVHLPQTPLSGLAS